MRIRTTNFLAIVGGLFVAWVGWGAYVSRQIELTPYEPVDSFDDVELRRYPQSILVETTAEDRRVAFGRLYRYLSGANEGPNSAAMPPSVMARGEVGALTAPVRSVRASSEGVPMTAPVRTAEENGAITMSFYLPESYTTETAPMPTDPAVRLVVEPPRTVAAKRFSWYATAGRTERNRQKLLETLNERGIEPIGEPSVLQYNDPWTPPFMRRNEVVVSVAESGEL